ncbi:MAG: hypothetical protein ABIO29_04620 [Sphingomicrobium sp.]
MSAAAALSLLVPGAALLALLALVATQRPDPTRAIHAQAERPRKTDLDRRRRRRPEIEI